MARRKESLENLQDAILESVPDHVSPDAIPEDAEPLATESIADHSISSESVSLEQLGLEEHQDASGTEDDRLRALVEAAVYITDEPLLTAQIASALVQPVDKVQAILDSLVLEYLNPRHGLYVRELAGGYQMATKAEHHEELRQFVKKLQPPLKLSLAALETLAVIAYKQPVTAPEILEIRGVSGAGVLKTLLDRKLVQISGRKKVLGNPALYKTTKEFLVQFGLKDLSELPTLKEFEELSRLALGDDEAEVEGPDEDKPEGDPNEPVETPRQDPPTENPSVEEPPPVPEEAPGEPVEKASEEAASAPAEPAEVAAEKAAEAPIQEPVEEPVEKES